MASLFSKIRKDEDFGLNIVDRTEKLEYISSGVVMINVMASGKVSGGFRKGKMNMVSAPSQSGKSFIGLSTLKKAQQLGMDCLVIDSENSFDFAWAEKIGIDIGEDKLLVYQSSEILDIRNLIAKVLKDQSRETRKNVFILIDSWGPLVSNRLIKNAETGNDAKDMSKSVEKNELADFLNHTRATILVINHVYDNVGGFGDPIKIPGGRRLFFLSGLVLLGTSIAKDTAVSGASKEILGSIISMKVAKGRGVVENKTGQIRIKHDGGLDPYYGLLEHAEEGGYVTKPKGGYFSRTHIPGDKAWKESTIYCREFWEDIFRNTDFKDFLEKHYTFVGRDIDISADDVTETMFQDAVDSIETQIDNKSEV